MTSNIIHIPFQITVTPLGALTNAERECQSYFEEWLPAVDPTPQGCYADSSEVRTLIMPQLY